MVTVTIFPKPSSLRCRTAVVQFVRCACIGVFRQEQVHRFARSRLLVSAAMKTTYDPPPPPMGLFGRLAESVAALLLRAAAILLPRHR